ncbi:MAG: MBL fold metallo-hydrolase [Oscillospiraceae bacterium]|jgi:L-ascorbate metabolism protein UlaG (beta-lactamase superfamily)|nr:MBL fold metallo-hydrolase [Oscillospiraceae bacterium]
MPKFCYQGHGSYRFTANDGLVIYVDPYAGGDFTVKIHKMLHPFPEKYKGGDYTLPADLILVTHNHNDHNQIQLVTPKPSCRIITHEEALAGGKHNSFEIDSILIEAVEAGNLVHNPKRCVGYILTIDGVKIYCSGDTSKTKQMESFAQKRLDYAILCGDGKFNMGLKEAAECAQIIGAKNNIIVHIALGALFDRSKAERWQAPNKLIIEPGEEIEMMGAK